MKKITAALLTVLMLLSIFAGCSKEVKEDPNTLTVNVGMLTPVPFLQGLREKFPDINFVYEYYHGANQTEYQAQRLIHGEAADIVMHSVVFDQDVAEANLVDLSGYTFLGNFDNALLNSIAKEGCVYQVPGPVTTRCILYSKTFFEENGWEAPTSFNELLALVKQIRADAPEVTPIAMGMVATGYCFSIVTSLAQCGTLSTPEGAAWEERYQAGNDSVGVGFDEGITMVEQLIDADAFDAEQFVTNWDVIQPVCEHEVAMSFVMGGTRNVMPLLEGTATAEVYGTYVDDEYGILPFFGIEEGQEGLSLVPQMLWGINKRLEDQPKKLENALKVMEYISTPEAQTLMMTDKGQIPAINNLETTDIHPEVQKLWKLNETGKKSFYLYSGYEDIMVDGGQVVMDAMFAGSSEGMREAFVATCDELHRRAVSGETPTKVYAVAEENLSTEQSMKLSMEAIMEKSPADFMLATALGADGYVVNQLGMGGRFFEGDITEVLINVVISNYNHLIQTVQLSGAEVKALLADPKTIENERGVGQFPYMAYGLDVTMKDGVVTSAKLNGVELEDDKLYTVNFCQGDYEEAFAQSHEIVDTEYKIFDAIAEFLEAKGTINAETVK